RAAWRVSEDDGSRVVALREESFHTAQWAVETDTAGAMAQMAARFGSGATTLATLVRERQDLQTRWQVADKQLSAAVSIAPDRRAGARNRRSHHRNRPAPQGRVPGLLCPRQARAIIDRGCSSAAPSRRGARAPARGRRPGNIRLGPDSYWRRVAAHPFRGKDAGGQGQDAARGSGGAGPQASSSERQALRPWSCARTLQYVAWSGRQSHRRQAPPADCAVWGADRVALQFASDGATGDAQAERLATASLSRCCLVDPASCRDGAALSLQLEGPARDRQGRASAEANG